MNHVFDPGMQQLLDEIEDVVMIANTQVFLSNSSAQSIFGIQMIGVKFQVTYKSKLSLDLYFMFFNHVQYIFSFAFSF